MVIDAHLIGNPYANYPIYLLTTIFPGILGLVVLLMTTYSVGIELKNGTSQHWLKTAGNNLNIAIGAKLLPYTLIYLILGLVAVVLMYLVMDFPMKGNLTYYMLGYLLFIGSMQCIGLFLVGMTPVLRDAICYATLYGILAVTMSGFTFPIDAMQPALQGLSCLFPLRQLYLFTNDVALLGCTIPQTVKYLVLIALSYLLPLTVLRRLQNALVNLNYPRK